MNQTIRELVRPRSAPAFQDLRVADAMTVGVIRCSAETRLTGVAKLMATHVVHAVFVFDYGEESDEDVQLWGVVSDLDLAAAAAGGVLTRTARESSVTPLVTVESDDSLQHAAELMARSGVSHLAVIDPKTGRPAGVLSTLDVARVITGLGPSQRPTPA